ncbi:dimethylaniline monooxygenase [N-oxide-forming] 5-like [Pecten maximus]|uniref:dimethylaniline monooxygenase [N-oxide-forming] 5-like n=1 Tax=Pecten maximus TaxID=6579 RepID=UPI001458E03B|nr:dimethylaniline monooxygenase [N-oxide-forming] 5-like [Pecten maximus]
MVQVAVIGAGASGLTAIKCCLDEGLVPTCFERTDDIGGLWNYHSEVREGQASVMKSTVINTSKETMCFSDFPIPQAFPIFMHNTYVQRYLEMYADAHHLRRYIRFSTEVLNVKQADDFNESGQWMITVNDKNTGEKVQNVYDALLVCTGHHASPHIPDFSGMADFMGEVIHSQEYKTSIQYENKRVVVVGIGNSGGDIAVELSRVTSQAYLSTRRGSWVLHRVGRNGLPIDFTHSRLVVWANSLCPLRIKEPLARHFLNSRFDHSTYALQPKHSFFAQHPMVNDDLPNRLSSGSVIIKADIKRFTVTGVEFTDGTKEENIDLVVLATGYVIGFPFIDKSVLNVQHNHVELYKNMFLPNLKKQTLCLIGCVQPLGALMPVSELQCRLATRVIKGDVKLPPSNDMWDDIRRREDEMRKTYVKSIRHTIQVDWIPYMDELATLTGCKPGIRNLLITDPKLAWMCLVGPCTPYQYRLHGPGKWTGARDAIMTIQERTLYPLKTRSLGFVLNPSQTGFAVFSFSFIILYVMCIWLIFVK